MAFVSKYAEKFKKLREHSTLFGNRIVIELIPKEPLKAGKDSLIYIATEVKDHRSTTQENRATVGLVLDVGTGYVNEDGSAKPCDVEVGQVVQLNKLGMNLHTEYPGIEGFTNNEIATTRDTEVQRVFNSLEAYELARLKVNE